MLPKYRVLTAIVLSDSTYLPIPYTGPGLPQSLKQKIGITDPAAETNHTYVRERQSLSLDPQSEKNKATPSPQGPRVILLAEDEETSRELLFECLSLQGYEVLAAKDGATALELARSFTRPISLLVTDLQMPHMNGYRLSQELLKLRPEIKVLFISGADARLIVENNPFPSGVLLMQKPFRLQALMAAVQSLCR